MNLNEEQLDQIHNYVKGLMDASEAAAFRISLDQNPALRKQVEAYQLLEEGIRQKKVASYRTNIRSIEADLKQAGAPLKVEKKTAAGGRIRKLIPRLVVAASMLGLILVSVYYLNSNSNSTAALAQQYYSLPEVGALRSDDADFFSKGLEAFQAKDWNTSVQELSQLKVNDPHFADAQYLLGHAYFQQKNYLKAGVAMHILLDTQQLEKVQLSIPDEDQLPRGINRNDIVWMLALIEAGQNQPAKAKLRLNELIQAEGSTYKKEAKALLEQLPS